MSLELINKIDDYAHCVLKLNNEEFHVQLKIEEFERFLQKEKSINDFIKQTKEFATSFLTPIFEQQAAEKKALEDRMVLFEQLTGLTTNDNAKKISLIKHSLNNAIHLMLIDETERGSFAINELYTIKELIKQISTESNQEIVSKIEEQIRCLIFSIIPKDTLDWNV